MGVVWARFGVVLTAGLLLSPHVGAQQAADADPPPTPRSNSSTRPEVEGGGAAV
jgi:hypothetical protein